MFDFQGNFVGKKNIVLFYWVTTSLTFLFFFDDYVRLNTHGKKLSKFMKKSEKIRSYIEPSIIPLFDAILVFSRIGMLIYHKKIMSRYVFYIFGVLRMFRYFSMSWPHKYWFDKIPSLDKSKSNNISTVFEIISALILVTNFLCCFWIFLGQYDYTAKNPNFKGANSWLIVYGNSNDG